MNTLYPGKFTDTSPGLVPAAGAGAATDKLQRDGTFAAVASPVDATGATGITPGTNGLLPAPPAGNVTDYLGRDLLYRAIAAGFTPGNANLIHAGTWTAYSTLALAKAAAVSGDTIFVGPGTYDEANLLKNGVNWDFAAGANVAYTGAGNAAIFDDGPNGANGDASCVIGGYGTFSHAGTGTISTTGGGVFNIINSSTIYFKAASVTATAAGTSKVNTISIRAASAKTPLLYMDIDRLSLTDSLAGDVEHCFLLSTSNTSPFVFLRAGTITATGTLGGGVRVVGGSLVLDTGSITSGYSAMYVDGSGSISATVTGLITSVYTAVDFASSSTTENIVRAGKIASTDTTTKYGVSKGGAGTFVVDCPLITTSGYNAGVYGNGGVLRVRNARITNTYSHASNTLGEGVKVGAGTTILEGNTSIVCSNLNAPGITAASAVNVYATGTVYMNKAKNANVTFLTGSYVESDSNVI